MIRPHLEYAIQVWNPYQIGDIEIIERVQRRATKIPKSLWTMSYSERLEILGFTTLEERRTRGDLIQMYKIVSLLFSHLYLAFFHLYFAFLKYFCIFL